MKKLSTITLLDLLPPNFKTKAHSHALSAALDAAFQEIVSYSENVKVYADIDNLNEAGLDSLAMQWKIKGYKDSLPPANKRQLVKSGLLYQLFLGTAKVIKDKARAIYNGEAIVSEWFEYGGEPYLFKVDIETTNGIDLEKIAEMEQFIDENKNARSHLEGIHARLRHNIRLGLGSTAQDEEFLHVMPHLKKEHLAIAQPHFGGFSLGNEKIEILPKETKGA